MFIKSILDGISLATDGVLYGASDGGPLDGHLLGDVTSTGNLVFDSGLLPEGNDGAELGYGVLSEKVVININGGTVYLRDHTSK